MSNGKNDEVLDELKKELIDFSKKEKVSGLSKFFQSFPGGYGEGDTFIAVTVPDQRKVAKKYYKLINLNQIKELLCSKIHEHRLTALFLMILKFEKTKIDDEKKDIFNLYRDNISHINNWDLVDSSAPYIIGSYLYDKDRKLLYDYALSDNMWIQRIAILSTYYFIKHGEFDDTLKLAEILLNHKHDLIHKAVGWMLREVSNRNYNVGYKFLKNNYLTMPRTMLRYAIEKYDEEIRQKFLKNNF